MRCQHPDLADGYPDGLFIAANIHCLVPLNTDPNVPIAKFCVKLALIIDRIVVKGAYNASDTTPVCIEMGDDDVGRGGVFTGRFHAVGRPRIGIEETKELVDTLVGQVKMDRALMKKTAAHLICIASCSFFKSSHHFLTEEVARTRKMRLPEGQRCRPRPVQNNCNRRNRKQGKVRLP